MSYSPEQLQAAYKAGYLKATGMDGWDKMDHELRAIEREAASYAATLHQAARVDESPEDRFEQYVAAGIARSPAPLRELGDYLARVLDEDQFPTAERFLLQLATAQPAERQGDDGVAEILAALPHCSARTTFTFSRDKLQALLRQAAPVGVPDGMVLVRKASLSYWQRELNGARQGDNAQQRAEIVHSGIAAYLAAAPSAPQGVDRE